MAEHKDILVGISIGDFNGVGPEVIIKSFIDPTMLQICTPVIYGSGKLFAYYRKHLSIADFNYTQIKPGEAPVPRKVNIVNVWEDELKIEPGTNTQQAGEFAFKSLEAATTAAINNTVDALVTAPINKKNIQSERFIFPGHTEYLAEKTSTRDPLMLMIADELRIGVATGHVPLKDVSGLLNEELILKKLNTINKSLQTDFGIRKPRIAVLGLNPHAGDDGVIGSEENDLIKPLIEKAKSSGLLVFGPYPADGFFGSSLYTSFDGVLAMYHDQGLAPFKAMSFGTGVNFTAGLPIVRTSPDHGTAYDIAGKNIADESSFRQAIYTACDIARARTMNAELTANPLHISRRQKDRER